MENQIINGTLSLDTLRANVADAVVRAYGAEREYAKALNAQFAGFDWFEVEANDVSDAAKPVHAEKKALYAVLKGKHSNPSTVWARVRKYGAEESTPKPRVPRAKVRARARVPRAKVVQVTPVPRCCGMSRN